MTLSSLIRNSLLTGACIGLLGGCSWFDDWPPKRNQNETAAQISAPPPPQSQVVQSAGGTWIQENTSQAAASFTPSHQMPKGLNIDEAAAQRIAALEIEVQNLRNELRTMMPAVAKLAAAQGTLQDVVANIQPAAGGSEPPMQLISSPAIEANNGNDVQISKQELKRANKVRANGKIVSDNVAKPDVNNSVSPTTAVATNDANWYEQQEQTRREAQKVASVEPAAAKAQSASLPQSNAQNNSTGIFVRNIRFGEHADKTRLVLDTSEQVAFRYDVDNKEQLLVVEMPETGWRGSDAMEIANSPIVSSYSVVTDGKGGHQLVMQLKQPTQVLWAQALLPGGPQGHRIVIDLAPI